MGNLKVFDLYNQSSVKRVDDFNKNIESNFEIESKYEKVEVNFEWLDKMEGTIRYLDNILRNPNRFIVNEEEVVEVEKARKITVESIKHLSKHTNFIQQIDKNGEVKPSKILNINKEESFNTYENRFIYTLILNMRSFIEMRKRNLITASMTKDNKTCTFNATSRVGAEKVDMSLSMQSRTLVGGKQPQGEKSIPARIEALEAKIRDLTMSNVYKTLAKMQVARVIPPIKKTNLILKNTNFQYATALWNYIQNYQDTGVNAKKKDVYKNDIKLQGLLNDVFLLNYLVVNTVSVDKEYVKDEYREKAVEELTNNMITKIVELNSDLPIAKLQEIIGDRIAVIKNKKEASIEEIQKIFDARIRRYLNKIESYKF